MCMYFRKFLLHQVSIMPLKQPLILADFLCVPFLVHLFSPPPHLTLLSQHPPFFNLAFLFENSLFRYVPHLFNCVICFINIYFYTFLIYLEYQSFIVYISGNFFPSFCSLPLFLNDNFLCCAEYFQFYEVVNTNC